MSSYHNGHMTTTTTTTTKARGKVVKPILRKLTQSEKNSLDLDRPAAQQDGLGIYDHGGNWNGSRFVHDVAFNHTRRGYHQRSTSGASQFSTATSGSGNRQFVHPFAQTPRPYTPPLAASYQNSLRESEYSINNSPALTEDEDQLRHTIRNASSLSNNNNNNRTPSLTSTSSPVISQPLRIQTKQPSSSRLAKSSYTSLHSTLVLSPDFASPTDTMSPSTVLRTSTDRGLRIRSHSNTIHTPTETVQDARRKWDERQREKEEKAAREEIKALERRNKKEAQESQRGHRRSSASENTRTKRSKSDLTMQSTQEKDVFVAYDYNNIPVETPPFTSETFEAPPGGRTTKPTAKAKTHSAWTTFVIWFRTRIIRLGKKKSRS